MNNQILGLQGKGMKQRSVGFVLSWFYSIFVYFCVKVVFSIVEISWKPPTVYESTKIACHGKTWDPTVTALWNQHPFPYIYARPLYDIRSSIIFHRHVLLYNIIVWQWRLLEKLSCIIVATVTYCIRSKDYIQLLTCFNNHFWLSTIL